MLLACGGTDNTTIPDSGGDGASTDVATSDVASDTGPSDTGTGDAGTTDSGGDAVASDGGFSPGSVPGLVLWLEGDVSGSITTTLSDAGVAKVTKWADQTSHHNDAMNPVAFGPTVKSSAINSLSAIHFDQGTTSNGSLGQQLIIQDNADTSLQWGTGDFFVAIVGDFDNDPTKGQSLGVGDFYSKTAFGMSPTVGVAFFGNVPGASATASAGLYFATSTAAGDFVTTGTAYNTGSAHLFVLRRRGGKMDLLVDGTSVASTTGTSVDVSNAKSITCIGAYGDPAFQRLDGDVGEIMAVKGVLLPADETGLASYLRSKWNTP